ncbi:unnamed protein product [Nippostrongylus brasiliensis]|uniref:ZM domain-containing protein n=1 Tax=Nippostrongylus brasiliensis TaxID=27835 RepID=A0A0N4XXF5_NIPBR|nr:unnamed protein product [Nippostrongylus brasiliensis]
MEEVTLSFQKCRWGCLPPRCECISSLDLVRDRHGACVRLADCHVPTILIAFEHGGSFRKIFGKLYNEGETGENEEDEVIRRQYSAQGTHDYPPLPMVSDFGNVVSHLSGTFYEHEEKELKSHSESDSASKQNRFGPWRFEKAKVMPKLKKTTIINQAPLESSLNPRANTTTMSPERLSIAKVSFVDYSSEGSEFQKSLTSSATHTDSRLSSVGGQSSESSITSRPFLSKQGSGQSDSFSQLQKILPDRAGKKNVQSVITSSREGSKASSVPYPSRTATSREQIQKTTKQFQTPTGTSSSTQDNAQRAHYQASQSWKSRENVPGGSAHYQASQSWKSRERVSEGTSSETTWQQNTRQQTITTTKSASGHFTATTTTNRPPYAGRGGNAATTVETRPDLSKHSDPTANTRFTTLQVTSASYRATAQPPRYEPTSPPTVPYATPPPFLQDREKYDNLKFQQNLAGTSSPCHCEYWGNKSTTAATQHGVQSWNGETTQSWPTSKEQAATQYGGMHAQTSPRTTTTKSISDVAYDLHGTPSPPYEAEIFTEVTDSRSPEFRTRPPLPGSVEFQSNEQSTLSSSEAGYNQAYDTTPDFTTIGSIEIERTDAPTQGRPNPYKGALVTHSPSISPGGTYQPTTLPPRETKPPPTESFATFPQAYGKESLGDVESATGIDREFDPSTRGSRVFQEHSESNERRNLADQKMQQTSELFGRVEPANVFRDRILSGGSHHADSQLLSSDNQQESTTPSTINLNQPFHAHEQVHADPSNDNRAPNIIQTMFPQFANPSLPEKFRPQYRTYAVSSHLHPIFGDGAERFSFSFNTPYGTVYYEKTPSRRTSAVRTFNDPFDFRLNV